MGSVIYKIAFKNFEEGLAPCQRDLKEIEMLNIDGQLIKLGELMEEKKVIMFVNVATK